MALTKEVKVDKIEVLEDGQIQVREATVIIEDGKELSRSFRRYILDPATDTENVSDKDARVQGIASLIWTKEIVDSRKAAIKRSERLNGQTQTA